MNIGLDIDDTIINTSSVMEKYIKLFSKKIQHTGSLDFSKYNVSDILGLDYSVDLKFWELYEEEIFKETSLYSGVINFIRYRRSLGDKVYIITAREKAMLSITEQLINSNNIKHDGLFMECLDKSIVCKELSIDCMVEDYADNIVQLIGIVPTILVKHQKHNSEFRDSKDVIYFDDWATVKIS